MSLSERESESKINKTEKQSKDALVKLINYQFGNINIEYQKLIQYMC